MGVGITVSGIVVLVGSSVGSVAEVGVGVCVGVGVSVGYDVSVGVGVRVWVGSVDPVVGVGVAVGIPVGNCVAVGGYTITVTITVLGGTMGISVGAAGGTYIVAVERVVRKPLSPLLVNMDLLSLMELYPILINIMPITIKINTRNILALFT